MLNAKINCWSLISNCPLVLQLEKLIEKNYYLHKSAQEAYKSYVRAYDSHSLKQIYSVNTLNLPMVALSFGFKVPPYVDLSILYCHLLCYTAHCLKEKFVFLCIKSYNEGIHSHTRCSTALSRRTEPSGELKLTADVTASWKQQRRTCTQTIQCKIQ